MKGWLLVLLLGMGVGARANWVQHITREDTYGFFLTGNRTRAVIPFEFRSNLIIVPVRVNESDTMRFIIDTGVAYTLITNTKGMTQPPGQTVRQIKLVGVGEGNSVTASVTVGNVICLKDCRPTSTRLLC